MMLSQTCRMTSEGTCCSFGIHFSLQIVGCRLQIADFAGNLQSTIYNLQCTRV
jgi:hypothetical protein